MGTLNPTHSLSSSSLLSIGVDRKKMFFGYTFGGGVVKPGVICGESRPVKEKRKVVISGLHSGSSRSEPDCGYACSVAVCCRHRKQIELSAWITDPYVMPAGAWPISQLPAVVRQRHCGRRWGQLVRSPGRHEQWPVVVLRGRRRAPRLRGGGGRAATGVVAPGCRRGCRGRRRTAHLQPHAGADLPRRHDGTAAQAERRPHQNVQVH